MRPLPFVWPYALIFWAIYVWAFLPEWKVVQGGREGVKDANSKDSGSLKVILAGMWVALFGRVAVDCQADSGCTAPDIGAAVATSAGILAIGALISMFAALRARRT